MAPQVAEALGRPFKKVRIKGLKQYEANICKAKLLLDYVPAYSMEQMLTEAIEIARSEHVRGK
jgi:nucleoside-diphosphate-sugar epimerase